MRSPFALVLVASLCALGFACGSSDDPDTGEGPSDVDDGRYHPEANGVHTTEAAACDALEDAQTTMLHELDCAGTTRPCPELLRAQFKTQCLEYDEGSVSGCVAYYKAKKTCDDLNDAIADCAVTAYQTAPAGCP
jgi:hypothetical protein